MCSARKGKTVRSPRFTAVAVAVLIGLSNGFAFSREYPQKGHDKKMSAGDKVREALPESEAVFTQEEIQVIGRWSQGDHGGLPPGLAKKDRLPPGLEKQLRRRGTLPPGLQKKVQPVPVVLERQLRVLPTGYRRVIVGGNIILMDEKTAFIYDIVRIAVP